MALLSVRALQETPKNRCYTYAEKTYVTRCDVVQSNYAAMVRIQLAVKLLCCVVIVARYISMASVVVWAFDCQTAAVFVLE